LASVIVPTRDRPAALTRCLDALAAQTIADRLEVIVVDDGSVARTEVASVVRRARARLIRQAGEGPAAARNAGARAAGGSFLCFTDDDCAPAADWAERLVDALHSGADAAAGSTESSDGALATASEIVAHAPSTASAPNSSDLLFAPSNNLACTRAVFEATPFDESYPYAAGEDRDWCARLVAAGYDLRSEPAARVVHCQALTPARFLRQQIRYGEAAYHFRSRHRRASLEPIGFYARLLKRGFGRGAAVGVLVAVAQVATAIGFTRAWLTSRRGAT
jgi:glycosyltransferase involved in cell wall biosynthesis